ncbi:MAG: vWA domain-containing protein [Ilumatobacteraceae bacterium]
MTAPLQLRRLCAFATAAVVLAACGGGGDDGGEPLTQAEAKEELDELLEGIDWLDDPVTRRASIPPPTEATLAATLPPIDEFPLVVAAPSGAGVAAEVFASTEKSGDDTDGWMVEVAEDFNASGTQLSDGSAAAIEVRRIPSGIGYQFIASGEYIPAGFSPSNQLWIEMASVFQPVTEVADGLVPNVAGIVMKSETATELSATYGELDASALIEGVIAGDVVMGYADPFASSTGLNFLLTVLDDIADGDQSRLTDPDVASVFEQFQRQVPFVALTTLQLRESVEADNGTLDAFVMEYQTYINTDSLSSGFEFFPFGVTHENPLYAVGDAPPDKVEALEAFAAFAAMDDAQSLAQRLGFEPPAYTSEVDIPSGSTLIDVQAVWKDKKDGGRPVATVFVADTSGSMSGTRIAALQRAMLSAREFIKPETSVGVVEFNDVATLRLPVAEFDLNQQGRYVALVEDLIPEGGTAMYDGIVLGLSMLTEEVEANSEIRPVLVVLSDGQTTSGLGFDDVADVIEGLRIPVFTVGFEADLDELGRLSSLVEAASLDANEADVEFKIASLFNAGG